MTISSVFLYIVVVIMIENLVFGLCPAVFIVQSIIGNLLVILAITLCPSLRKRQNVPLASLSVSDILFTALHPPMWVNVLLNPEFRLPWGLCVLQSYTTPVLWGVSLCHMGCIAVYRYFRVIHFHRFPAMTSTKAVCAEVAMAWLVPMMAFIAPHVHPADTVFYTDKLKRCAAVEMTSTRMKTIMAVAVLILPCVVAMVFYVAMYLAMRKSTNTILVNSRQNSSCGRSQAEHTDNDACDESENVEKIKSKRNTDVVTARDHTEEPCLQGSVSVLTIPNQDIHLEHKQKQVEGQAPMIFCPESLNINRLSTSYGGGSSLVVPSSIDDTATCIKPKRRNLLFSDMMTKSGQLPLESTEVVGSSGEKTYGSKQEILRQKKTNPRLTISCSLENKSDDHDSSVAEDIVSSVPDRDRTGARSPRALLSVINRSDTTSLASIRDLGRQVFSRNFRAEKEMLKMLLSIFVCCMVCNVPAIVMIIIEDGHRVPEEAFLIGLLLWAGNAAMNPIIYGVMNTKIRKGYREIWNVLTRQRVSH
ncbi:tyramine receptor 1-like [Branchiostoma lanceolatum]|uniref:tyramine receptor 1-like n=1 Tax=Branchiostoma lanceolatum TaxID=7740 RepID=UPI003452BBBC